MKSLNFMTLSYRKMCILIYIYLYRILNILLFYCINYYYINILLNLFIYILYIYWHSVSENRGDFSNACIIFQNFVIRSRGGIGIFATHLRVAAPYTMRFLTCHPPCFPRLYSGCSRYLQHAWLAYMRAFEPLTMGKAPLNGRHARCRAGQSLDYLAADFSRCFSPAAVTAIVLFSTRRCNFSGVNRTM